MTTTTKETHMPEQYGYADTDGFYLSARLLPPDLDTLSITVEGDDPQSAHVPVARVSEVAAGILRAAGMPTAAEEQAAAIRRALENAADMLDESKTLRDYTDDHMGDVHATTDELRRMAAAWPPPAEQGAPTPVTATDAPS